MKQKTKKRIQGSISVLLVIILLPMMTFSAIIVDLSRLNMASQMMSSAGDLTMSSALANYDTILKDVYGLFAMSQQEGTDLATDLTEYFKKTLCSYGVVEEENADDYVQMLMGDFRDIVNGGVDSTNFLELNNITLDAVVQPSNSSLANSQVLRKQIVEYMKYRAPLGVGMEFLESLTSFQKMDAQNTVVEAQVKAQESTQGVTAACKKLMEMIRAYDKRVTELNAALAGVTGSGDTAVIPLEDYDSHPMKYLSQWTENYTHINKLNLVFLARSPSVDGVWLKGLNYATEKYVKADGTVYSGSNPTGFSVSVTLAGDTASALAQVTGQITNLNSNYKKYTSLYAKTKLPSTGLDYSKGNNINKVQIPSDTAKEDAAIGYFIDFEKFLLNKSENGSITYTQMQDVLKQIATLEAYRVNYGKLIDADIARAKADMDAKKAVVDGLVRTQNTAAGKMDDCIEAVNTALTNFFGEEENTYGEVMDPLPERTGSCGSYYNSHIKSPTGGNDKYLDYFNWLLDVSPIASYGTKNQKAVIAAAKAFVSEKGIEASGFETYMKKELSSAEKGEEVYSLLVCLKSCLDQARTYRERLAEYNKAGDQLSTAREAYNTAKNYYEGLKVEKTSNMNKVKLCLQDYHTMVTAYQADAYYYNHYVNAAKNTITPEISAIQSHFSKLLANLKELRDDLEAISTQVGNVKGAIKTYNDNLETWGKANKDYAKTEGGDSFSSQTQQDVEKAKTEYDAALYETLDTFVIAMWNEFDDLYSKLSDPTNFLYGALRIDQLKTADEATKAVSHATLSEIVTIQEATQALSTLYVASTEEGFVPYTMDYGTTKQLCFLTEQILQIQALKYLNATYPEAPDTVSCGGCGDCDGCKTAESNKTAETDYNTQKGKLTDPESSGDGSEEASGSFGYSFKGKSLKTNLPSGGGGEDSVAQKGYKATEEPDENGKKELNASKSVGSQKKKTNNVLSGIGDIATTAVENLFILNYIFENFSYNTIVQEAVLEANPVADMSVAAQMEVVKPNLKDAEKVKAAKAELQTLSNFPIDATHNYLFGGEVEYILFGNKTPATNVTSAKASIYAVRFGFNCIYAFTDSTIRNSTMSAGLAVQAATLGVVPYQVVQIVLQLALAAAESAVDLSAMNHGLDVAVVKTKDTWSLSVQSGLQAAKDVATATVTATVTSLATQGINAMASSLNSVLEAGADKLGAAINDYAKGLTSAAESVFAGVVDDICAKLMAEIEGCINGLLAVGAPEQGSTQTTDPLVSKARLEAETKSLFAAVKGKVADIVNDACGSNEAAKAIASRLITEGNKLVENMETSVLDTIAKAPNPEDVAGYIAGAMNEMKVALIAKANTFISNTGADVSSAATSAVNSVKTELQDYIKEASGELTEEAANAIKSKVNEFSDKFMNEKLTVGKPSGTGTGDPKSSIAALFKFGYKDYLMLLTYIKICTGDAVLKRTADVIQMNMQHAGGDGAKFTHSAKSTFLMSKAYTYVSISASADLDMFFMDFDIFADQVAPEPTGEGAASFVESSGTKISYKGLLGY